MEHQVINLAEKLSQFDSHWTPHIVSQFDGHEIYVVKVLGEFVWHDHADTDDFFLVLKGSIRIELRDTIVTLNEGDLFVVPKTVEHRRVADEEAHLLIIEKAGTPNTGDPATAVTKKSI